jgi:hypothetical protein
MTPLFFAKGQNPHPERLRQGEGRDLGLTRHQHRQGTVHPRDLAKKRPNHRRRPHPTRPGPLLGGFAWVGVR